MQLSRVPGARRLPMIALGAREDVVLFDSWGGRYSDSPRAVSDELHRRRPELSQVWVLDRTSAHLAPDWASSVEPGSLAHLRALGRAGRVVSNNTLPGYYRKPRDARYLQTWHGTPLKRIAFDIERPQFGRPDQYFRNLAREVRSWDWLVSPNRFSTEILRRAFRYEGQVVETGYPRNDLLCSADAPSVRARVRRDLGLGKDDRAVLYAPTFRDGQPFSLPLDLSKVATGLGEHSVLLIRAHHLDAAGVDLEGEPRIRDVSDHADIAELHLAADVLITDYSSAMFDFAVTRKPMLFFTYDLDAYRDRLRGFYFDFEAEAPGPLLRTTDEVMGTLADLPAVSARHAAAYERFVERFCHLDDGGATGRVVDVLLGSRDGAGV